MDAEEVEMQRRWRCREERDAKEMQRAERKPEARARGGNREKHALLRSTKLPKLCLEFCQLLVVSSKVHQSLSFHRREEDPWRGVGMHCVMKLYMRRTYSLNWVLAKST